METDKDRFKFFHEFIFTDLSEGGDDVNVNVFRKYIMTRFHITIPPSRILKTLSLFDDIILKLHNKDLEVIQDDMYSVSENVLYILSFETSVEEDPAGDDDGENE